MKKQLIALFSVFALTAGAAFAQNSVLSMLNSVNSISRFHRPDNKGNIDFSASNIGSARRVSDYTKKGEIKNAEEFGTLTAEDGSTWMFASKLVPSTEFEYFYGGAEIRIYNSQNEPVTTVKYEVPAGKRINEIVPFGNISSKFFDTNSKTQEFLVYAHEVGTNYEQIGHFLVFNTKGELVKQYDNLGNIIWFDASEKWDTYQRALFVTEGKDSLGNYTTQIHVMKPASWSSAEPTEEHLFEVRNDLIEYSNGPCLNTYKIDGKPYYSLSYYEKPFVTGYDENWEMILQEDNNYIVEIYDSQFKQLNRISVPVTHPDDVFCSLYTMGLYSYNDLTRGYFTGDDKFNVILTRTDVRLDTADDTYPNAFLVYDSDSKLVNTIATNAVSWKQMAKIRGMENQVGVVCLNDGVENLHFINLPSCTPATVFPAEVDGRKISSTYDRYPVGDSYQYAISMGDATEGENGEVIASIGWFTTEGKLDHYTTFDLGTNGEYFTPLLEDYSLNPFLVNTDSKREYIYIAKLRRTDGSDLVENVLIIADEDGKQLVRYSGGEDRTFRMGSVIDYNTELPRLVVAFSDNETGEFDLDFYNLPFESFVQGGDGTAENPYVIMTAGDIQQMAKNNKAHYVLGADVYMNELAEGWSPVPSFAGVLDGQGHKIHNLYVDNNSSYSGLFGYLNDDARITNLAFVNAKVVVEPGNSYVGTLAGMTLKAHIDSVFVHGLEVSQTGETGGLFGGLLGQATVYSTISSCGVKDADINLPSVSIVGGIVADTRTSSTVDACYFQGDVKVRAVLGGMVGNTGKGSTVKNCHVKANLTANETVGGLVGSADRETVKNNFVEGTITATAVDMYGNVLAGGIIGLLTSDWTGSDSILVEGNVVAVESITAPEDAKAVHRIVGFTIADEQYERDETPKIEKGLKNNYAVAALLATDSKGNTTPDGADVTDFSKSFFASIGFLYGQTTQQPWGGDTAPVLYIEDELLSGVQTYTTAADAVSRNGKYVENGRIVIVRNGVKYNTNGVQIIK